MSDALEHGCAWGLKPSECAACTPPIPANLCGVGGCVYLPHALGTKHSWAPGPKTRRLGETLRDAERRELSAPEVVVNITSNDPTDGALVAEYLAHHAHRWAYLTRGGQECVVCGARR